MTFQHRYYKLLDEVTAELTRAEELHPSWPSDCIHAVGIITEEVGEAMREAIDFQLAGKDTQEKLRIELIQSAAMCMRALLHMDEYK